MDADTINFGESVTITNSTDTVLNVADNFIVDREGNVEANSINATGGTIGGFEIDNAIYSGTDSLTSTEPGVYLGTDGIRQYNSENAQVTISNGILNANADKKYVKVMTKSSYPHLMKAGVKIYEYLPGFIHEKTFVSDDKYAVIGTINFDYRSFVHHFENAVWMYATPTVLSARDEFLKTKDESELVGEERSRLTPTEWLMKNAIRLFAPLL